ncbi:hypothetical protein BC826DRAFT_973737 [Russula brevipes]|nr:hypothetical protein BC826DRAFT_973737 [Russula brevipes]
MLCGDRRNERRVSNLCGAHAPSSRHRVILTESFSLILLSRLFVGVSLTYYILGVVVSVRYSHRAVKAIVGDFCSENHDKTETLLVFGASRFGACRPLAVEALRLALTPTINRVRWASPCLRPVAAHHYHVNTALWASSRYRAWMTGAILGGADVKQAARLQMIIMFMISASSALSCIVATLYTLYVCIDSEHCIRGDRIDTRRQAWLRAGSGTVRAARRAWILIVGWMKQTLREEVMLGNGTEYGIDRRSERAPLLSRSEAEVG